MLLARRFEERIEAAHKDGRIPGALHLGGRAGGGGCRHLCGAPIEGRRHRAQLVRGPSPGNRAGHAAASAVRGADGQGDRREKGTRRPIQVPASGARAPSSAAAASSAPRCPSPPGNAMAQSCAASNGSRAASSATAAPISARPTRRSTWPASGSCRSSSSARTTGTPSRRPAVPERLGPTSPPRGGLRHQGRARRRQRRRGRVRGNPRGRREAALAGEPTLIEARTYRVSKFSTGDLGGYVLRGERAEEWLERDPLRRFPRCARRVRAPGLLRVARAR